MTSKLIIIGVCYIGILSNVSTAAESSYGPFNLQSGKVQKAADGSGKTAHRDQCYDATEDRFFQEDSWHANVISQHGKNTYCEITRVERQTVNMQNDGINVPLKVAKKFCYAAHAETGSGALTDIGATAWIECEITATQVEFKK
ncbi:hypothetical protein [Paraburkholderia caribensis]|uniref:hypothetical protein n=1 Tax=Paraburkholderia caribensis TaxID=75105 RepID=UPI0012E815DC|nr:hypothetical protein [Paraburkholderia caribensis]